MGKLYKTGFNCTGHWRAKGTNFKIAPGRNIAFSSKRRLIRMSQLVNEACIKLIKELGVPETGE